MWCVHEQHKVANVAASDSTSALIGAQTSTVGVSIRDMTVLSISLCDDLCLSAVGEGDEGPCLTLTLAALCLLQGYLYSAASKLIGVEMNQFFYCLQQETVEKFKMADRVELVHGDICNQSDLLNSVDVIVLNNVFECFHDNEEQVR